MVSWYLALNKIGGRVRPWRTVIALVFLVLSGCTQFFDEAFSRHSQETKELMELVKAGDARAQTALGQRYELGDGFKRDGAKAKRWYQRAADQGDLLAMFLLGQMFETGALGVPDYHRAATLYTSAAGKGHAAAQARLAHLYEKGRGVPQDFTAAAAWYTSAAQQWEENAHYPLGATFATGRGNQRNSSDAIQLFQRAAGLGVAEAQYDLGLAYEHGNGVKRNLDKSFTWYQKSALQGHDRATNALRRIRGAIDDAEFSEGAQQPEEHIISGTVPSPARSGPEPQIPAQLRDRTDNKRQLETVFMAHLASYRQLEQVTSGWDQLTADHTAALQDLSTEVSRVTLPKKGTLYRIEVGPFADLNKAKAFCSVLKARNAYCRPLQRIR